MNEIDLIKEVEKRPILYDKTVSGFNKPKLRDDAWKEVHIALRVSEAECKKRWRSLRDSFIKLQRTHGNRTRWPYLNVMMFLAPHVEPSFKKEPSDDSDQDEENKSKLIKYETNAYEEKYKPVASHLPINIQEQGKLSTDDDDSTTSGKKRRHSSTEEETVCQCNSRTDPDELFLLSCSSQLKRLNSKRNAVARLKIQQALYEAEFGYQNENMPYVTPVSECGFDNVEGTM